MKYVFTDFYLDFECIGGTCMDTCCAGWNVFIDDATYQLYSELPEPKKSWICNQIIEDERGKVVVMRENGRCPFLNNDDLCEIYIRVSPDAMSNVCKSYPRKILQYYDVILSTVSVSCPEVARVLLAKKDPIAFEYVEDELKGSIEHADWSLYNELINGLVLTTDIIQNRLIDFWKRVYVVIKLVNTMQTHIECNGISAVRGKLNCYRDEEYLADIIKDLSESNIVAYERGIFIKSLFNEVFMILRQNSLKTEFFEPFINDINDMTNAKYETWVDEFRIIEIDTELENLAVEFVFEYFMEALKGNDLLLNITKMCLLLIMIRTCEILTYHKKGELLENDKVTIISKISRTMEHTPILDIIAREMLEKNTKEVFYQLALLLY